MGLLLVIAGIGLGALTMLLWAKRRGVSEPSTRIQSQTIFERVSEVGRLVGLEVRAKEIATSTKGWSWLPPLLMSPARLAMIFQFEKQYAVDLGQLASEDVTQLAPGRFRVELPAVEGRLRLIDVTPYDIQAGRVLGLLDVIQMNAATQQELMTHAQEQAAKLYHESDAQHELDTMLSIERQLGSLLTLFGVEVEFAWRQSEHTGAEPILSAPQLAAVA